jgi:hypothetical protein
METQAMTAPLPISRPWGFGSGESGGGVMVPPNVAQSQAEHQTSRVILFPLPEMEPIPDAQQFNPTGQQASAGPQPNILVPGVSQDIPASMLVSVRSVSIFISDMLPTTNVQWTLRYNTIAVPGFQNLSIFPRTAPFVGTTFDALIRLTGAGTLDVVFNNIDGGVYTVGASFSGWFWPVTSDARWKLGGQ